MPTAQQPVHLLPLVSEAVRVLRRALPANIDVQWQPADRVAMVNADLSQVQQLVMNLATNARDAMPRGGTLALSLADVSLDAAARRLPPDARPGNYVRLSVSDTGTGMTPEVRERIFDPFFTTKDVGKGTGLGLATVHGIVKAHDGFISVSSELGKGSEFEVYLPALETRDSPREITARATGPRGKTILLVEDDASVLEVARTMLNSLRYNVLTALDGEQALNAYRDCGQDIDLVITDMMMPGMDGTELCRALWKLNPDLKVILASAYSLKERERELLAAGVCGFLQKPFQLGLLETIIRKALDGEAAASPADQMIPATAC
jgi:CheY-like chemotaxis protein